jgi:hypothetical protein
MFKLGAVVLLLAMAFGWTEIQTPPSNEGDLMLSFKFSQRRTIFAKHLHIFRDKGPIN